MTPRKSASVADRELERRDARAEPVLQLLERPLERRPLPVELVHEDRAGDPTFLGEPPRDLGLHLDALDRRDDEHREVGDPQCRGDVADEVGVARRVDQVDLVAVELERRDGERHRDAASGGLGVEVADGVAVLDPTRAGDRAGGEEQRLGQGRLARSAVADEGDVSDPVRREGLHTIPLRVSGPAKSPGECRHRVQRGPWARGPRATVIGPP